MGGGAKGGASGLESLLEGFFQPSVKSCALLGGFFVSLVRGRFGVCCCHLFLLGWTPTPFCGGSNVIASCPSFFFWFRASHPNFSSCCMPYQHRLSRYRCLFQPVHARPPAVLPWLKDCGSFVVDKNSKHVSIPLPLQTSPQPPRSLPVP